MRRRLGYFCLVATAAMGVWFAQSPVAPTQRDATSPVLQDRNGTWLNVRTVGDGTWRIGADIDQIDPAFIEALVKIEDRRFYQHSGVDGAAILRAVKSWWSAGEVVSGASTITMQLVRQYKPRPRTLRAKAIESAEALRFELHYSKTEILTQYLSRVSYGGNIEGVEAASRIYLGKSARYLAPDEIALLIALPQAPEARRPDRNANGAKRGRNRILRRMEDEGLITAVELEEALAAPVPLIKSDMPNQAWLTARKLAGAGERAESFIDPDQQASLERRLNAYVAALPHPVNASAILVHAPTREVRAHAAVGRRDHDGGWMDMTSAVRSPGSTLKPFVYGLGMDDGIVGPQTRLQDAPTRFGGYRPENFDRRYYGDVTLAEALQHSLNIPAVSVLDKVGGKRLDAVLRNAGVALPNTGPGDDGADAGLALALGGTGMRATDLAALYTAVANDGIVAPLRWTQAQGETANGFNLLQAATAQKLRKVMADAPRPEGVLPAHLGQNTPDVAYKTGTSYGFRDSWAAGLSGDYTIVVWVGRPDGGPRPGITGRLAAAPLLFDIANDLPLAATAQTSVNVQSHPRLDAADVSAPIILFPAHEAAVMVDGFGDAGRGLNLAAQSSLGTVRYYVDGKPVEARRDGHIWHPPTPGFYKLTAVDARGGESYARFRVMAASDVDRSGH